MRVTTTTLRELKSVRNVMVGPRKGVILIGSGIFITELVRPGMPRITIDGRTGEIRPVGGVL